MSSLQGLWLNNSPVENIEPLRGLPLITLTLRGTNVKDLSPLAAVLYSAEIAPCRNPSH